MLKREMNADANPYSKFSKLHLHIPTETSGNPNHQKDLFFIDLFLFRISTKSGFIFTE
jgi:hypothetical protein